ncbi:hypothetical protein [Marinomonas epiphytica]
MLDVAHLTSLTEALETNIANKSIDEIQSLCEENNGFIFSIKPSPHDPQINQKIKRFIQAHQAAVKLVSDVHQEMQKQLFQSTKARKGVKKYKGVKHAE